MKLSTKMALGAAIIIVMAILICCFLVTIFTKETIFSSVSNTGLIDYRNFEEALNTTATKQTVNGSAIVMRSYVKDCFQSCHGSDEYALWHDEEYICNNTGLDAARLFTERDANQTGKTDAQYIFVSSSGRNYFIASSSIVLLGKEYVLSLVRDITDTMDSISSLVMKCIISCAAVIVIAVSILAFFIWKSLQPIKLLAAGAEQFASGVYGSRIRINGTNELSELANSFNGMAEAVEQHICRIEAISEERKMLLSALSHEMKTPVTAITGYAHALTKAKLTDEQETEAIMFIDSECKRLERLSRKLMQLISLNSMELTPQSVSAAMFIDSLKPILQPIANASGINTSFDADEQKLNIERDLITCLVTNLFDNARKAGANNIHISLLRGVLCVADDGKGIPKAEIQKIMQPFYVLDKSRNTEGFGLGLALVRRIAELHGAELLIESEESKGTSMRIQL